MKRKCRICGCTDTEPCIDSGGNTCAWAEYDLCTACDPETDIFEEQPRVQLYSEADLRRLTG